MKNLREDVRSAPPLEEGQTERVVEIIRRTRLQRPIDIQFDPSDSAQAVARAFGGGIDPFVAKQKYREKTVGRELEVFRWMKPGKDGLVPK